MTFVAQKTATSLKTGHSILRALAYFDLFNYPLTREEILMYADKEIDGHLLTVCLQGLIYERYIFRHGDFYSLQNDPSLRDRRLKGNRHAQTLLTKAYKISALLYKFPYVRGIGISGSLSKNFADEQADIDFFIITKSNRLWIARTIMHLFKKLTFLVGKQHWFCMNYYIDEEALPIEEKNIFIATELITLIPVYGNNVFDEFFLANEWVEDYYPNYAERKTLFSKQKKMAITGNIIEWLFNNRLGSRLDNYLMKLTSKRWKEKEEEKRLNIKGNRMGLKTSKHFSKPNPVFFQQIIVKRYAEKIKQVRGLAD